MTRINAQSPPLPLTPREIECLACLAGLMIPASEEFGMPGADDPAIIADMVASLERDRGDLRRLLARVDEAAGGSLASLPRAGQAELAARLRSEEPGSMSIVEAVVSRACYRDARVLRALGLEPRPPFPKGFEVEQGDFSLLDPVRARGKAYRDAN